MASRLNPYLTFGGDARQAMEFYQEVFGGTLELKTFGEFGQAGAPEADKVMHSVLESPGGFTLMASDTPPGMTYTSGDSFAISLTGDDDAELRGYWERLSAGGSVAVPLEKQMWGDTFGMCTDRFGVRWLVNIGSAQG
ncbi:VOC family protein [Streptomyces sp. NPDC090442]|jgi:PhnB protein|uniref:VOC family protein n=1 Tax=Streptomyces sp. NPDC090442 TaxID=3365962 RepID=UPI00382EEFA9